MALTRLLLLIVGAFAQYMGVRAPNVEPPTEQLREQHGLEPSIPYVALFLKIMVWSWAFLEGSIIFALSGYCPPALAHPLRTLPTLLSSDPTAVTPVCLAGMALILPGAFFRVHCYRTLGKHFTFELSLRPSHALVTDGVYSIVRHPSYTALTMLVVGYLLCALDRRGPIVSVCVGLLGGNDTGDVTVTGVLACLWATGLYTAYALLYGRMNREDEMLKKKLWGGMESMGKEGALSRSSGGVLSGTRRCDRTHFFMEVAIRTCSV